MDNLKYKESIIKIKKGINFKSHFNSIQNTYEVYQGIKMYYKAWECGGCLVCGEVSPQRNDVDETMAHGSCWGQVCFESRLFYSDYYAYGLRRKRHER